MKNLILIFTTNLIFAQFPTSIDTSYTAHSTFIKEKNNFPFIEIVKEKKFDNVIVKEDIIYRNIGNRQLHLDVYYSKEVLPKPTVILIHGGGWKSGNKSQLKVVAQRIASKGYACFTIEYRLASEAKYPAAIYDVKEAIKFVKANAELFNVDSSKIVVLGCSSGGQMAALIGTTNGDLNFEEKNSSFNQSSEVQAIINIDGILAFKHPESEEGKVASTWLGGKYEDIPEVWSQASALTHAGNKTPPILFINSDIPSYHAGRDDMITVLNKYGIYSEINQIHNSPHSFWFFNPWYGDMINYITTFLDTIFLKK